MKYAEVLSSIYARDGKSSYYTLGRTKRAALALGNPQDGFPAVHITGSNGKGSVARMVFEILRKSGLKTALFTSPHIHRYSERIRIGGREIPRREIVRKFKEIERLRLDGKIPWITFFEITTLIAFGWFADEKVDIAVVEVGLGGRLDATNICHSVVSVVTTISMEHSNILGASVSEIAGEKSGIIKEKTPVVCGKLPPSARKMIRSKASRKGAPLRWFGEDYRVEGKKGGVFNYFGPVLELENLKNSLSGKHQIYNAAVGIAAIEELMKQGYRVKPEVIPPSLKSVKWEGRLERISKKPEIILDCAHNLAAIRNLAKELNGRKFHLVFGALFDKPIERMFTALKPFVYRAYVSSPKVHRSPSIKELRRRCAAPAYETVSDAFDEAVKDARETGLPILVTGSVFVVSEVRTHYLCLKNVDPPVAM